MREILPTAGPGPHPSSDALYRARRGPRTAEAEGVLRHAALCGMCAAEEAAQDAYDAADTLPEDVVERGWTRFGRREGDGRFRTRRPLFLSPGALALAASILLALGAGFVVWRRPPPDTVRGGESSPFKLLSPIGALAEAPAELTFSRRSRGPVRVTVFDPPQSYVWRSELTTGDRVAFPAEERAKLIPGVDYYWVVGPDGGPVTAAEAFRVR